MDVNLFYRMRSLDRLLGDKWQENDGKDGELEKQEIYFASPSKLNDPMEGFSNIVFQGDKIVWHNFFKHYIMCLERRCNAYILCKEWDTQAFFDLNYMMIRNTFDDLHLQISKKIFNDIYKDFKLDCNKEIDMIATRKTLITKDELYHYLKAIHFIALAHIDKHYIKNGFSKDYKVDYFKIAKVHKDYLVLLIECWKNYTANDGQNEKFYEMCRNAKFAGDYEITKAFLNLPQANMTMYDLPVSYLEYVDNFVYPKHYISCFLKECNISLTWSHYADGHRGVCLIFKNLANEIKSVKYRTHISFQKVNYGSEFKTINFFENLGNLTKSELSNWYLGENGEKSPIADKILGNEEKWRKAYQKKFYKRILTKTIDWKYENEYRLVIPYQNELIKQERIFKYNFNDLDGIIFGMKTPQDAQEIIIKIIKQKYDSNIDNIKENSTKKEFKIYKAYYCEDSKKIQHKLYHTIR